MVFPYSLYIMVAWTRYQLPSIISWLISPRLWIRPSRGRFVITAHIFINMRSHALIMIRLLVDRPESRPSSTLRHKAFSQHTRDESLHTTRMFSGTVISSQNWCRVDMRYISLYSEIHPSQIAPCVPTLPGMAVQIVYVHDVPR